MDDAHQTLLDQISGRAVLVRGGTRELVAANPTAAETGASLGGPCFAGVSDDVCRWCKIDELWSTGDPQRAAFEDRGRQLDARWVEAGEELSLCVTGESAGLTSADQARVDYEDLYENAADMFVSVDVATGIIIQCNRTVATTLGYETEEIVGRHILDMYHPDSGDRPAELFRVFAAEGTVPFAELVLKKKDGSGLDVSLRVTSALDAHGKPRYSRSSWRDISKRKRAEGELRRANVLHRAAVDRMPLAYMIWDTDGLITEWNPAAELIFGFTKADMLGRSLRNTIVPREVRHLVDEAMAGLMRGELLSYLAANNNIRKDGALISCRWHNVPLKDDRGEVVAVLSMAEDITESLAAEDRLRQAQRMETVGHLAGGIAHDFNNLLTVIGSCCHLLEMGLPEGAAVRDELRMIQEAADQATTLTAQLLAFSRRQVLRPEVVDLGTVVANLEPMLRRLIGENVSVTCVRDPELGHVKVDARQMEQVILNLAVNGRDAMVDGGELTIETANVVFDEAYCERHPEAAPGPHVMLAVSDTGEGMDEATRRNAFDPFFTTKEIGRGTGLGLATVHGIVKQSRGYVWIYSELGRGTTFKIYFPMLQGEADTVELGASTSELTGGDETILVVEDNDEVRAIAARILRRRGYTILEASSGEQAASVAEEHDGGIDLLLTDVVMPGGNGPHVAKHIGEQRPGIKTLYMSGYTDNAIVHHGVLEEDVLFLEKPFTPATLCRAVRAALATGS